MASGSLRVAVYADAGAEPSMVLALFRGLASQGHLPLAITTLDVKHDRLNLATFDVLVIPAGQDRTDAWYRSSLLGLEAKIRSFVAAGGGYVGIEAGARYACTFQTWDGVAIAGRLDLYSGRAHGPLTDLGEGMAQLNVDHPEFLPHTPTTWFSRGASWFTTAPGAETIASYHLGTGTVPDGRAAIVRAAYGSGRCVLVAPNLELEEDTEQDWTHWDNRAASSYEPESDWPLLGELVEWAAAQEGSPLGRTKGPSISATEGRLGRRALHNPLATRPFDKETAASESVPVTFSGETSRGTMSRRFAIYATRDVDGGAWPGLLPALARSIEHAGHQPVALRAEDIRRGRLTRDRFDVLVMPGGFAWGYVQQLSGHEQSIRSFVNDGGGYVGISAGSFYEADRVIWHEISPQIPIEYPLDLYSSIIEGDLEDVAPWPTWNLATVSFADPTLWSGSLTGLYWGEGFYWENGFPPLTVSGRLTGASAYAGTAVVVRHSSGAGRVFSPNFHFEVEEGDDRDWAFFDDWQYDSTLPQVDPETDWDMLANGYDWVSAEGIATSSSPGATHLAVRKGEADDTEDSLSDAQRKDPQTAPLATRHLDGWYSVARGNTMELTGFGLVDRIPGGRIQLEVEYRTDHEVLPSAAIEWSVDGVQYSPTEIKLRGPTRRTTARCDLTAAGLQETELENLRIRYQNRTHPVLDDRLAPWDSEAGAPEAMHFDVVRIVEIPSSE